MKKFLLLISASAIAFTATAQNHRVQRYHHGGAEPTVYIISVSEKDTITCMPQGCNQQDLLIKNATVKATIEDHKNATRDGFQQVLMPSAIFADKRNTFSCAIGGDIALRAAYSFDRIVNVKGLSEK